MRSYKPLNGRSLVLALAAALCVGPTLTAAQKEEKQEPAPSFPSVIELVTVDVLVLDKDGRPVPDLKAEDFVVKEEGTPQKLSSFEAINLRESVSEPPPSRLRVSTNTEAPPPAERSFVIVFDDANITQYNTPRAKEGLTKFIEEGLREGDQVTLVPTAGGQWWTGRVPENREDLLAVVSRLDGKNRRDTTAGYLSDYESMQIVRGREPQILSQVARRYYENGLLVELPNLAERAASGLDLDGGLPLIRAKAEEQFRNVQTRSRATLEALERIALSMADIKGRKTILLVSDGFVYDPQLREFRDFLRAARNSNVVVYFLDARGTQGAFADPGVPGGGAEQGRAAEEQDATNLLARSSREVEGARSIAADTGGEVFSGNDLARGMREISEESRAYYLLGYTSANTKRDGKFRKIQVAVNRQGVEVRARRGYYAPDNGDKRPIAAGQLDPVVRAGLDSPNATAGIPMRLASYVLGPAGDGKSGVLLVAEADPSGFGLKPGKDGNLAGAVESYVVISPRDGGENERQEKLLELNLPPAVHEQLKRTWLPVYRDFKLAPGVYQARLLLRSKQNGRVGVVRHEFRVDPAEGLRVSTPVLTDTVQGETQPRPLPVAHRQFRTGARLFYLFEIFGAASDQASGRPRVSVSYSVRRADGTEFVGAAPRQVGQGAQGQMSQMLSVALQGAQAGEYEVVLTVKDEVAGKTLELRDPFAVVS